MDIVTADIGLQTVATIKFGMGTNVITRDTINTLADGNYQLNVNASRVTTRRSNVQMAAGYSWAIFVDPP